MSGYSKNLSSKGNFSPSLPLASNHAGSFGLNVAKVLEISLPEMMKKGM